MWSSRFLASTVLIALGCTTAACSPGLRIGATAGVASPVTTAASPPTAASAPTPRGRRWNAATGSLRLAPSEISGAIGPRERARVVRLSSVNGRPMISVSTAVGPAATAAVIRNAQAAPGSVAVAVDGRRHTLGQPASNDTLRSQQWALNVLSAENTWVHSQGAGVTVAVIDTGVSAEPDLAGQLLPGIDYVSPGGDGTNDQNGHGTHVAGIIAALANNAIGIAGLAPRAKILPVRVLDGTGSGYDSDIATGIDYAADNGAKVINLSFGGPDNDPILSAAITYAQSKGALIVAAAGNSKTTGNAPSYPAAYPGVLAVGATDSTSAVAYFSNTGAYVQIAAPGVGIVSTYPGGYATLSGTSMASPYVAATAALVESADPALTATAVAADLTKTADDLAPKGRDDASGAGLVDPLNAVCAVTSCTTATPTPTPTPTRLATRVDLVRPPASLVYGSATTLDAQVRYLATGVGLAAHSLSWCAKAGTAAAVCHAVATDGSGIALVRFTPTVSSTVYFTYAGDNLTLASPSASFPVAVTPKVTLKPGKNSLMVVTAPAIWQTYYLQRFTGKLWVTLAHGSTAANGAISFGHLVSGYLVHIVMTATRGRAATTTPLVRIL